MPVGGRAIGKTGFSSGLSASGKDFIDDIKISIILYQIPIHSQWGVININSSHTFCFFYSSLFI